MLTALELKDKIEFLIEGQRKFVELYYGDITALPVEQKVDILMVSAFHGDYTPTPGSLIGSLYRNCNLLVGALAQDKSEDLRKLFYCWWSKPLPDRLPFRRLLCFETSRSGVSPQKAVQSIFKALLPACSLFTDGSVISPLLSTGDQGHRQSTMLTAMVSNAVLWMENGLSLTNFKLVIYRGSDDILNTFSALKKKYNVDHHAMMRFKSLPPQVKNYDFYISAADRDKRNVEQVKEILLRHKSDVKFYMKSDQLEEEALFGMMKQCSRVLAFLSPEYLSSDDCVEEYNAAWCLNRSDTAGTKLAPMLCAPIDNLPTYMSLIQWVDIRLRDGNLEKMVNNITMYVMKYVQEGGDNSTTTTILSTGPRDDANMSEDKTHHQEEVEEKGYYKVSEDEGGCNRDANKYDIFISYAHSDSDEMNYLVNSLLKSKPDLKIFIDRQELHTGGSWQERLYQCVEGSKITIACLSPSYLQSKMCYEEFKLSLARHFTEELFHLVPMQVVPIKDLPNSYCSVRNSSMGDDMFQSHINDRLVPAVIKFLQTGIKDGAFFSLSKRSFLLSTLVEDARCAQLNDLIYKEPKFSSDSPVGGIKIELLSSSDSTDERIITNIRDQLQEIGFTVGASIGASSTTAASLLTKLDSADLIVPVISTHFISNLDLVAGLQVAINRHLYCKDEKTKLYPLLMTSALNALDKEYHVYYDLLQYELCLTDSIWDNWTLERVMKSHPNYSRLENVDEKSEKIDMQELRFVTTAANRIAYHATQASYTRGVLKDVFTLIREIVLEEERKEEERAQVIEQIQKNYAYAKRALPKLENKPALPILNEAAPKQTVKEPLQQEKQSPQKDNESIMEDKPQLQQEKQNSTTESKPVKQQKQDKYMVQSDTDITSQKTKSPSEMKVEAAKVCNIL